LAQVKVSKNVKKFARNVRLAMRKNLVYLDMEDEKPYTEEEQPVTQVSDLDFSGTYTYASYLKWTFEERLELIKGKLFKMSPASNRIHQELTVNVVTELSVYLKGKSCKVYVAPFDVRLPRNSRNDQDIITVIQPDVCVICDPAKLDDKGCLGAPDIVVEILSPGNNRKEMRNKFEVYQESGVREYWVVLPAEKILLQYILNEQGKYSESLPLTPGDTLTTPILPGFTLDLEELFAPVP